MFSNDKDNFVKVELDTTFYLGRQHVAEQFCDLLVKYNGVYLPEQWDTQQDLIYDILLIALLKLISFRSGLELRSGRLSFSQGSVRGLKCRWTSSASLSRNFLAVLILSFLAARSCYGSGCPRVRRDVDDTRQAAGVVDNGTAHKRLACEAASGSHADS